MKPLISIIVVNFNGRKWLKKLFDSLALQTNKDFEIIFVDNSSNDDSVEYVRNNYIDGRIKIIQSDNNLGFAGGNNLGIKNANSEYILLLNNDVWVDNDFVEKMIIFYESNNYDVVAPLENDYKNAKKNVYVSKIDLFGHPVDINKSSVEVGFFLSGVCLFFKKSMYFETLGLDSDFFMYFEEIDWFWRLHLLNKKSGVVKNVYVHHSGAGSTGNGIKYLSFLWRNQNTLQMLLKNYKFYNLMWVIPIYFIQNLIEILFFLLIFKPRISYSYLEGWYFNILNFKKIMKKRNWVQENRVVGDSQILKKMYMGLAKIKHFNKFFLKQK